uniref:Uncharacterized protein n=1 Tax=Meloidogyne enterolobii TaxID=390850 RepID=A0A6V7UA33_MELEN|nr:unnamed protein product [Meloidogyne enterolobii]
MEKQLSFLLGVAVGATITSWIYLFFYKKNSGRKFNSASSIFNMEPITSLNLSQSKTLYNLNCCSINTDEDKPTPSAADLHRVAIHEAGHVVASFFCEATERAIKVYNKKKSPNGFGFNRLSAAATSDFLKNAAVNILKPVTGFNVYESPTLYNLDCCCIHKEHANSNLSAADLHRVAIHEAGHVVASFLCESTEKAKKVCIYTTFVKFLHISRTPSPS